MENCAKQSDLSEQAIVGGFQTEKLTSDKTCVINKTVEFFLEGKDLHENIPACSTL